MRSDVRPGSAHTVAIFAILRAGQGADKVRAIAIPMPSLAEMMAARLT